MEALPVKPFLITKDEDGGVRLTVRETRHNSQNYPWVVSTMVDMRFASPAEARAHAVEHLGAQSGEFAHKYPRAARS